MTTHLDNEAAMVREAQGGNTESFSTLIRRYEQRIYRLGYVVTKNSDDAEGVLQETFTKAYVDLGQFNGETRFYTWLIRIAMNEALTKLRQRYALVDNSLEVSVEADEPVSVPNDVERWREYPENCYTRNELGGILSRALLGLETRLRLVFALRDMEGLSAEDTARLLGISVEAAKGRLLRARLELRDKLSTWFKASSVLTGR